MIFCYQKISFALFYVRIYPLLSVNIFNSLKGYRTCLYSYLSLPVCLSVYIGSFYRLISYQPNLILTYNMSIIEFNKNKMIEMTKYDNLYFALQTSKYTCLVLYQGHQQTRKLVKTIREFIPTTVRKQIVFFKFFEIVCIVAYTSFLCYNSYLDMHVCYLKHCIDIDFDYSILD